MPRDIRMLADNALYSDPTLNTQVGIVPAGSFVTDIQDVNRYPLPTMYVRTARGNFGFMTWDPDSMEETNMFTTNRNAAAANRPAGPTWHFNPMGCIAAALGILALIGLAIALWFFAPAISNFATRVNNARNEMAVQTAATPNAPAAPYAPAQPAAPAAAQPAAVAPNCPSLEDARRTFGVDVTLVGSERCAYTWTSPDGSYHTVPLTAGWMSTTAEPDGIYITEGNGSTVSAHAATWRFLAINTGLTSDVQYTLEHNYAALPQNNFADLVKCRTCKSVSNAPAAPAAAPAGSPTAAPTPVVSATCPDVAGFTSSTIDGGCLYKSASPATFNIPSGWKALYGTSQTWKNDGSIENVTQVSLYKK